MRGRRLFRRLRALFRRRKSSGEFRAVGSSGGDPVVIQHHVRQPKAEQDNDAQQDETSATRAIPINELLATTDSQTLAPFFARLPLEIRRIIYLDVWRAYLKPRRVSASAPGSDLRLHIYKDTSSTFTRTRLTHTRCRLHPGEPPQEDAFVTAPWPLDLTGNHPTIMPPRWYWEAWVMRLNWGKHWKCQHAIQKRWSPLAATRERPCEHAPFLPLFLACKRMYSETMQSLLENVTLVFTSSLDAHYFFLPQQPRGLPPRPFLAHLRSLELSFTNMNDHLYLTRIVHDDDPPLPAAADDLSDSDDGDSIDGEHFTFDPSHSNNNDSNTSVRLNPHPNPPVAATTTTDLVIPNDSPTPTGPSPSPRRRTTVTAGGRGSVRSSTCFNIFCRADLFGPDLWLALTKHIRAAAPGLRDLDVGIAGRVERGAVLGPFGEVCDSLNEIEAEVGGDAESGNGGAVSIDGGAGAATGSSSRRAGREGSENGKVWALPGKVAVAFEMGRRCYVQRGGRMVRVAMDEGV